MKTEKNICLIGFMGTGKSTISQELHRQTGMSEVDVDKYIEAREQRSINDMFETEGEDYFRDVETDCIKEIASGKGRIIACGGGAVLRDENVDYLKENGVIVLLTATPETVFQRVCYSQNRPILKGHMNVEFIRELMETRRTRYEAVADIVITTDDKRISGIAEEILIKIEEISKK